jgi:hypothetical protein
VIWVQKPKNFLCKALFHLNENHSLRTTNTKILAVFLVQGLEHSTQHLRLKVLHIPKSQVGGSVARDAEEVAKPTRAAIFAYSAPVISIFSNSMPLSISS